MHYISVIMSVYNEREIWLKQAIESILTQTYTNFEFIIILDNPSNDNLRKLILDYSDKDNRIRFIENEKNRGLVYSLNLALKLAKGNLIARMDADDISEAERFEKQINLLDSTGYDIVATAVRFINEEGNTLGVSSSYGQTPEKCKQSLFYRMILFHPTWMFRSNIIEDIGLYNNVETAEDYDLICRAVSAGKKAVNMPEVLSNYRLRNNGISIGKASQQNRTMQIIQREYSQSIRNNKQYDGKSVIRQAERIDYGKKHSFYSITSNLYKDACSQLKSRNIKGFFKLLISLLLNLSNLKHFVYTVKLKRING
ncbi:glycosyltransferase [Priestia megaterium]|uniref:glycosyltransferase n=1 Tax=Priestia megaterium TaxID=1404 RepID=UPI00366BB4F8